MIPLNDTVKNRMAWTTLACIAGGIVGMQNIVLAEAEIKFCPRWQNCNKYRLPENLVF